VNWNDLTRRYYELQQKHGDSKLDPIISGGERNRPDICFIFMNPTARNIASSPTWSSIKAPWIGTKNIWRFFSEVDLLEKGILEEINEKKPEEWSYKFAEKIYSNLKSSRVYVTNLAKCTQPDARPLPNSVFRDYLPLLENEMLLVNPKKIVTFGNQVSSIVLQKNISVSKSRRVPYEIRMGSSIYPTYPVYYPIGQGQRNISNALEDVAWILRR
jgi:uracil-DNA glycosylase